MFITNFTAEQMERENFTSDPVSSSMPSLPSLPPVSRSPTMFPPTYQFELGKYMTLVASTPTTAVYVYQTIQNPTRRRRIDTTMPPYSTTPSPDFTSPPLIAIPTDTNSVLQLNDSFIYKTMYPVQCNDNVRLSFEILNYYSVYNVVSSSTFSTTTTSPPFVRA